MATLPGLQAAAQDDAGIRAADTTEIAWFRMTGIEGYVLGRYWRDVDDIATLIGTAGSGETFRTRQALSNLSGRVFVMTHNYVYHPNLVLLDLGVGPVYFRSGYDVNGTETTTSRWTYDVSARATFLRTKPYRGALFYDRLSDSQPVGPAQSLLTENTRYGLEFALLQPLTPTPTNLSATRSKSKGRGTEQIIDDDNDEINLRIERSWGTLGDTYFHYQWMRDDSKSGSVGLPIFETSSRTHRADLNTFTTFGDRKQYDFVNAISYSALDYATDQGTIADSGQFRFDAHLRTRYTNELQSRLRYQFDRFDQKAQDDLQSGHLNAFEAGLIYDTGKKFSATLNAIASLSRSSVFDADLAGLNGTLNHVYELPLGELVANYGLSWQKRDQTAKKPIAEVLGERVVLAGSNWETLRRPLVVPGSVMVSNVPRTQIYVEGRDYALQIIGLSTQISRLIGGAIVDGQQVFVDYSYDTGGTYAVTDFDNTIELAWRYKSLFSAYVRYFDTSPRLDSGTPTSPLNPSTTTRYGMRADAPFELFGERMQVGGQVEWEDRREVISPYTRRMVEAYLETTIPQIPRGGLRVGARRQETDYDLTPDQNITQDHVNLRLWSRFRNGLSLEADGMWTRETGRPEFAREYLQAKLRGLWRIRRFLLSLEIARTKETQGAAERTHTRGQLDLRRDF